MYASRTFVCNHEHMLATVVDNLRELDDRALTDEFRRLELERRRIDAEMAATVAGGSARANPRCGDQLVDSIDVLLEQAEQLIRQAQGQGAGRGGGPIAPPATGSPAGRTGA